MSKTKSKRDYTIEKSYRNEIDLQTKAVKSKKAYSRKEKYKPKY